MLEKYKDKKILITGFEVEGKATFEYLNSKGIKADIADWLEEEEFYKRNPDMRDAGVSILLGKKYLDTVSEYDVVFRTPGLSPLTPELVLARGANTEITSQINLFMDLCLAKTVGVTGTKGKGTTSSLIYEILKASGKDVYLGGNIGVPAISFLDDLKKDSVVVLELSSFQLMDLKKSPNISVVLNITREHLDYHKDRKEYVEAKKSIVKYQEKDDFAIINTDYDTPRQFEEETDAEVFEVSTKSVVEKGCYINENDDVILKKDETEEKIVSFTDLRLRGRHNLENICPAVVVSSLAGADLVTIERTVKGFQGLEHRLEFVAEVDGVEYYNDSFATTPETTIAAINAFDEPIILISGGSEKGSDYTEMGRIIAEKVKTTFLIGDMTEKIRGSIYSANSDTDIREGFKDMVDLVERTSDVAKAGDVVVLSPGCASFGLFKNYAERGELFKKAVRKLK